MNILYQCDDNYAPYAGISIISLLLNNIDVDNINIYILSNGISKLNRDKIIKTCKKYNRSCIFLDCDFLDKELEKIGALKYKNSYTTFYKLFVYDIFKKNNILIDRLLYIDCDTLIIKNIKKLYYIDMGLSPLGMSQDILTYQYKNLIGLDLKDNYYNAGIILFDFDNIVKCKYNVRLIEHLKYIKSDYEKHDQDILNVEFKNEIYPISQRYNMQPIYYLAKADVFVDVFKDRVYLSVEEIINEKKHATILHLLQSLGDHPWDENSIHPYKYIFEKYKNISEWKNLDKSKTKLNVLNRFERVLYKVLPRRLFLYIFKLAYYLSNSR